MSSGLINHSEMGRKLKPENRQHPWIVDAHRTLNGVQKSLLDDRFTYLYPNRARFITRDFLDMK